MNEIEQVRREVVRHGEAISAIVTDARNTKEQLQTLQSGIESDRKVRQVEDKHLNERLDDIEKSIEKVFRLGLWSLGAFGSAIIVGGVNFIINGGLAHP